jgi:cysteine desulfuration protein SufE
MPVSEKLDAIVEELRDSDHTERMELLIEMARALPPLPERLEALRDEAHRVPECVAQVFLFVEVEGDRVRLFADVPESAPATRGFVGLLVEALDGAPVEEVVALDDSLVERSGLRQSIGMQRLGGFYAILRRLRREVVRQAAGGPSVSN